MTTIPSRLARATRNSSDLSESHKRAIQLYRDWYRSAPEIVSIYGLNVSPSFVRLRIRQDFERNRYVGDLRVIDVLLTKGRQDYQEVMNAWQQEPHILGKLLRDRSRPQKTFMQKFIEGRDEEAAIPASPYVQGPS